MSLPTVPITRLLALVLSGFVALAGGAFYAVHTTTEQVMIPQAATVPAADPAAFLGTFSGIDDAGYPGTLLIEDDALTVIDDSDGNAMTLAYTFADGALHVQIPGGGRMTITLTDDGIAVSTDTGTGGAFARQ